MATQKKKPGRPKKNALKELPKDEEKTVHKVDVSGVPPKEIEKTVEWFNEKMKEADATKELDRFEDRPGLQANAEETVDLNEQAAKELEEAAKELDRLENRVEELEAMQTVLLREREAIEGALTGRNLSNNDPAWTPLYSKVAKQFEQAATNSGSKSLSKETLLRIKDLIQESVHASNNVTWRREGKSLISEIEEVLEDL